MNISIPFETENAKPISELLESYPSRVFVISYGGKYGCYKEAEFHGLAAFDSADNPMVDEIIDQVIRRQHIEGASVYDIPFNDALDIAKERPFLNGVLYFDKKYRRRRIYAR